MGCVVFMLPPNPQIVIDRWVVGVWGDVSTLPFRLFENAKIDEWLDVSSALLITTEALKSPFCSV